MAGEYRIVVRDYETLLADPIIPHAPSRLDERGEEAFLRRFEPVATPRLVFADTLTI